MSALARLKPPISGVRSRRWPKLDFERERHAVAGERDVAGLQIRMSRIAAPFARRAHGDRVGVAREQAAAELVIRIHDAQRHLVALEQARLGGRVALHRAVEIQMIARQVGEHRRGELHRRRTPLHERVRRDFDGDVRRALVAESREQALQAHSVGCRVRPGLDRATSPRTERPDVGRRRARGFERLCDQPRAGGLAVRAGDADDAQRGRRIAEESRGDLARPRGEVRHGDTGHGCRQHGRFDTLCRFPQHRARAARERLVEEIEAVIAFATAGEERTTRRHGATVERETRQIDAAARRFVRQQLAEPHGRAATRAAVSASPLAKSC